MGVLIDYTQPDRGLHHPLRSYLIDPATERTEELYLKAVEGELGRSLDYDEWEDQRTKWAKEWC